MGRDQISRTQLMALLWAGVLAPAAGSLPGLLLPAAGKGAWLSVLAAAPLVLAAGHVLGSLSGREGLAHNIRRLLGPVLGRVLLIIYVCWAQLLLALRLRLCAERLLASGSRDGSLWFFLLGVAAVALCIGMGRLPAFARAGQLFFTALLLAGGLVLLLSLPKARLARILPLWWEAALPALESALPAAGVLGWGLFAAFLIGDVAEQGERKGWHWLFWGLGGCVVLAAAQAVILGNLGAALAAKLDSPFFALAKHVGVKGAFQRIESVIAAVWILADLTLAGVLLFAQRGIIKVVWAAAPERRVAAGALILAVILALGVAPEQGTARRWNEEIVPWGNLILGLGVPFLLLIWDRILDKYRKRGTSCGEKTA